MVALTSVLSDDSALSRADRALYWLEKQLALLSGLAVLSLMVLAVLSVGGRNLLNQPLPGYVDWIEQIMPLIAFLGISYTQRDGGHIRMDMLVGKLHGRVLWLLEFLGVLTMLVLMLLLVWGSWAHFERSFDFSATLWSRDSSMDIAIPLWPAKLLAPVAFSVLCLRLLIQLIAYGKAFIDNSSQPVAVPRIQDIATQAAAEAEIVSDGDDK